MHLPLNDIQLAVLRWIAEGCDMDNPVTPGFKVTAVALHNRGLVDVHRRGGQWSASLTDDGTFYSQHGRYPDAPSRKRRQKGASHAQSDGTLAPQREGERTAIPTSETDGARLPASARGRPVKDESIPMPGQIRKPHAAVRELVDHKKRLDVPAEQRQRALVILHAIVQEALRRGWTVTPILSELHVNSWDRTKTRIWPSNDLFTIDAGDMPAAVRLRMRQRQVKHVPTKDEAALAKRWGYQSYRSMDLVPTDRMRLEIRSARSTSLVLEDTATVQIEAKLKRAIDMIQLVSDEEVAWKERQRIRAIEEAQARERAETLRNRATHYGKWVTALESMHAEVRKHRELHTTVEQLRAALPQFEGSDRYAELETYLEWAEQYLAESQPFRSITLPEGEVPDLPYAEWRDWNSRQKQWMPGGL